MNKTNIVVRNNTTYFQVKSRKKQQLNVREIEMMKNQEVVGLFPVSAQQNKKKFTLEYNITGYVSLRVYLKSPLDRKKFAMLLNNVFSVFQSLKNHYLNEKNVLMKFQNIMVNPSTKSVSFIYVPILDFDNEATLRDLLLKIVYHSVFIKGEDVGYIKEYISILNKGINFSLFEMEKYIHKLMNYETIQKENLRCKLCNSENMDTAIYCIYCGTRLREESVADTAYNPLLQVSGELVPAAQDLPEQKTGNHSPKTNTQNFSETMVLGIGKNQHPSAGLANERTEKNHPQLIREKNHEIVAVDKELFRIGKDPYATDYCITDNTAVSNYHVDFIQDNDRYYIVDRNSTNKTFVDNNMIPAKEKVEITDGAYIRLADEAFVFKISS